MTTKSMKKEIQKDWNEMKEDWDAIKDKIKMRFSKVTKESIDSLDGNLELLSKKIQSAYGYAKEKADKEVDGLKASLHAATRPKEND
ncbi:MAG TPA: hypothetical protein VI754_17690 [Bacteriovoracaceae bacterium]|nr:hypothetical protein [Bacteriovoracaceae bacterium]